MSMLRLRSPSEFDDAPDDEKTTQRRQSILNRNNSIVKNAKKPLSILSQSDFFFLSKAKYYWHAWIPENRMLIGIVILFHGLHEHSGRYKALAEKLCDTGLVVFGVDLLGHGRSDGKKGYIENFDVWVQQAEHFYKSVSQQIPWSKSAVQGTKEGTASPIVNNTEMNFYLPQFKGLPIFLFGQGIGGTVSLFTAKAQKDIAGVVLSAPLLQIPKKTHYLIQQLAVVLSTLTPQARVVDIAFNQRCHNEMEIEAFKNDPLCCQEKMFARTGYVLLELTKDMTKHFPDVSFPFVVMQGTDDRFCDPAGAKALHEMAASKDKSIMLYEGFWHDLLHEVCADEFISKTAEWIAKKCGVKIAHK